MTTQEGNSTPTKKTNIANDASVQEKELKAGQKLDLNSIELSNYRIMHERMEGLNHDEFSHRPKETQEITFIKEQFEFTEYNLTAEVARYLNKPCLQLNKIINSTEEGFSGILELINQFNEVLYDHVIPRLFDLMYDIESEQSEEEFEVALNSCSEKVTI